jgi:hypothetical protein
MEYSIKDGDDWDEYEKEDDNDPGDALLFDSYFPAAGLSPRIMSAVESIYNTITFAPFWREPDDKDPSVTWILRTLDSNDESDWELWVNKDGDAGMSMAETCHSPGCGCEDSAAVKTEFDSDVTFCARSFNVKIAGSTNTGAEDQIRIRLTDDQNLVSDVSRVEIDDEDCYECTLDDSDCEEIAEAEEDGTLVSLSGATIVIDGSEVEEPQSSSTVQKWKSQTTRTTTQT